jgi:hypothetical protein
MRLTATRQLVVEQLHLAAKRDLEASSQLSQRAAGTCPQHHVKRLTIGPREFVTHERLEDLEELAIPEQQPAFVFERGLGEGEGLGATPHAAGTTHSPGWCD